MSKSYVQNQEATFHLESWLFKVPGILNFMAYEIIPTWMAQKVRING